MPNWCFTDYVIDGDSKEVADLHQKLTGLIEREASLVENGFGKNWLGNVAELFGKKWQDIYCRGTFYIHEVMPEHISLSTETAWADCYELWTFVCSQYKTLRFYFRAEEGGCCYWATNDAKGKYFPERFMLDVNNDAVYYFDTEEEALKAVSEKLRREITSVADAESAIKERNEGNPDDWMSLNKYKVIGTNTASAEESTDKTEP
jgi:hypothetical protein